MSERGILANESRCGSASRVSGLPWVAIVVLSFLGFGATDAASQQLLRNRFTGSGSCLDIVNDGQNDKVKLAPCGNFSGQHWIVGKRSDGAFQFKTEFTGEGRCLDIVNDGQNNHLHMAPCGNFTGQQWIIISENGNSRLKTNFTGPTHCLDVVNDAQKDKVQMATCGNFSGQLWSLTNQ
jgi:Ricin-type beta-trefoil lectin domain